MLKACKYCGKIHSKMAVCTQKPKKEYSKRERTIYDRFRSTSQWQKKRHDIKQRDMFMCQVCLHTKECNPYRQQEISVHHITPLAVDYSKRLDDDNLITLCNYHHELAESGVISAEYLHSLIAK